MTPSQRIYWLKAAELVAFADERRQFQAGFNTLQTGQMIVADIKDL